ncbi:MAG: glycosyltransferase family 4 protein [Planctomycetes bacterium]|nr:glycosyltransferase family 4 protein [Planctomycetota bacterium]
MNPEAAPKNLLMLSGDTVLATGRQGVFFPVLEEMARHFTRIDVISPPPGGAITTRSLFGNVHLHPNPRGRLRQLGHILTTARALLRERPYLLITSHDYGLFYNGIAAYRLHREFGVPYVSEIHHVPGFPRPADLRERLEVPLNRIYARFAAKHAVAIRVVNRVEMPTLLRSFGVPDAKIRVIPSLYLDVDVFTPTPARAKDCDVLLVGRLVKNKRFDLVLDAVGRLKRAGRDVRIKLVGEGPLKAELFEQATRLGLRDRLEHGAFLPTANDLADAYRGARMLVCSSTSEGGPRVTCEAMACAIPVISTPVGIMTELVHVGVEGRLFSWDVDELATHIAWVLDHESDARAMAERGRAAVLPFERKAMIANYATRLIELAAKARA